MRLLVINQYFPPDTAASAYILGELTEDLGVDHSVHVVAGRPSYTAGAGSFQPKGVQVSRVPSTSFDRGRLLGRAINYLTFLVSGAFRTVTARRPDAVVAMTDPPLAGLLGVLGGMVHRRPFVLLCHDVYPDIAIALGVLRPGLTARLWKVLNVLIWRYASRIVVVGRDMAEKLEAEGVPPARITYIPTWSLDFEIDDAELRRARDAAGWRNRFVVMHSGNQGLAQNIEILGDLARHLAEERDIEIVVLGDGAGLRHLKERARVEPLTNLTFLAHRPRQDAQLLMSAADLHVVSLAPGLWGCAAPSKTYGIMAAGRPFVAAVDAGSEPDRIAREHDCGRRVPAGDGKALAEAVRDLRRGPLDELGTRGRAVFERSYRRPIATGKIERVLEEVVRSS